MCNSTSEVWCFGPPGNDCSGWGPTFTSRDGAVLSQLTSMDRPVHKENIMGSTFLVCHGAWSAGWAWKKMHPLMAVRGNRLGTPTHTGLGAAPHRAKTCNRHWQHIQSI